MAFVCSRRAWPLAQVCQTDSVWPQRPTRWLRGWVLTVHTGTQYHPSLSKHANGVGGVQGPGQSEELRKVKSGILRGLAEHWRGSEESTGVVRKASLQMFTAGRWTLGQRLMRGSRSSALVLGFSFGQPSRVASTLAGLRYNTGLLLFLSPHGTRRSPRWRAVTRGRDWSSPPGSAALSTGLICSSACGVWHIGEALHDSVQQSVDRRFSSTPPETLSLFLSDNMNFF